MPKRLRPFLGTFVEIGAPENELYFEEAVPKAFAVIEKVQKLLSFHDSESELSLLNQSFGTELILDPITIVALKIAKFMNSSTDGFFEAGPQMEDLKIRGRKVLAEIPMQIDLGGIAKGYAVDLAVKELKAYGVSSGWINAGGDLKIFGDLSLPMHRRTQNNELEYLGEFRQTAIATSVAVSPDPERFPGKILKPQSSNKSSQNIEAGIFTVQAPSAWLADALTKVAVLAPSQQAEKIVERFHGKIIFSKGRV